MTEQRKPGWHDPRLQARETRHLSESEGRLIAVDVKCRRCRRRWMRLLGSQGPSGPELAGPPQFIHEIRPGIWENPWTQKRVSVCPSKVAVAFDGSDDPWTRDQFWLLGLTEPTHAKGDPRLLVKCHPRCGVQVPVTMRRLRELYAEAVSQGRAEVVW